MPVSSNTMFHFTNSIENIESILKDDFIPRCSLETIFTGSDKLEFAYPMVCFCDIPLSQVTKHIDFYGHYGIGLSKSWGIANGLNPVLYVESGSDLAIGINDVFDYLTNTKLEIDEIVELSFTQILKHIKSYTGNFVRNNEVFEDYIFYDEREWRYLPATLDFLNKDRYKVRALRDNFDKKYENIRLKFIPDDIKYIIIHDESEIERMIQVIRNLKGQKYSMSQVERLITRIITTEQILKDF